MPEPTPDDVRLKEINEAFDSVDKVFVDEINKRKLSFMEIEVILLYMRKKIDTEEWMGYISHKSDESATSSGLYS